MSTAPAVNTPTRRRWLHGRRKWVLILLGLVVLVVVVLGILALQTPGWYDPPLFSDPNIDLRMKDAEARRVQLAAMVHEASRTDQTWSISDDEINAWVAVMYRGSDTQPAKGRRLDQTLHGPMIRFVDGAVELAARTTKVPSLNPNGGVVSARISFEVRPAPAGSGMGNVGMVHVDGVWIGDMPLPRSLVTSNGSKMAPEAAKAFKQARTLSFGASANSDSEAHIFADRMGMALRGEPFELTFPGGRGTVEIKSVTMTARRVVNGVAVPGRVTVVFGPLLAP